MNAKRVFGSLVLALGLLAPSEAQAQDGNSAQFGDLVQKAVDYVKLKQKFHFQNVRQANRMAELLEKKIKSAEETIVALRESLRQEVSDPQIAEQTALDIKREQTDIAEMKLKLAAARRMKEIVDVLGPVERDNRDLYLKVVQETKRRLEAERVSKGGQPGGEGGGKSEPEANDVLRILGQRGEANPKPIGE